MDARVIAREMLYAKQRLFEHGDKPGKQLTRILSNPSVGRSIPALINPKREMTKDVLEKLDTFVNFYQAFSSQRKIIGMLVRRSLLRC